MCNNLFDTSNMMKVINLFAAKLQLQLLIGIG